MQRSLDEGARIASRASFFNVPEHRKVPKHRKPALGALPFDAGLNTRSLDFLLRSKRASGSA
jgi:hypothetical protein